MIPPMENRAQTEWLTPVLAKLKREPANEEAWCKLYKGMWSFVMAINRRTLHDVPHVIEDATQEVFLRLVRYGVVTKIEQPNAFFAYIRAISNNVCADMRKGYLKPETRDTMVKELHQTPERAAAITLLDRNLQTDRDKQLFALLMQGYTLGEIA